ncbi:FtsB family cell division protein [Streptococcus himalayensis]|uniref:Cell division protein DIVIC n=1 Tax=Streptococcus himalayensis TaxID=1888195 RepID=A0A917A3K3_9STRE|nr:septum formation initiator family protein [Streptococcus himalayensis]GGE24086.1 cell division protein DIVIC [Streptococcus himalayensis]
MPKNIVQLNNQYIKDEHQHRRYLAEERKRKNRFMGWILILVMLLFILPMYNLVESYQTLLDRREQLVQLQDEFEELSKQKDEVRELADRLKDDDYAAKYARAKYYYSKEGETLYTIPGLLPQ